MKNRRFVVLSCLFFPILVATGAPACALLKADAKALTPEAEAAGVAAVKCVVTQALAGQSSAAQLAITCGLPAAADALAIAVQFADSLGGKLADGGIGAPLPSEIIAKLRAVH